MDEDTILRFCNKIKKDELTGCWNWVGAVVGDYGCFRVGKSVCLAHRVSMHLFKGTPLKGYSRKNGLILHRCNNQKCVNPHHLYLGNQKDNVKDSVNSGSRFIRKSKYSTVEVAAMRDLNRSGYSLSAIAELYGCCKSNMSKLINGKSKLSDE